MFTRVLTWWFKLLIWIEDEATVALSLARANYDQVASSGLHPCGHAMDDHEDPDECPDESWVEEYFGSEDDEDE